MRHSFRNDSGTSLFNYFTNRTFLEKTRKKTENDKTKSDNSEKTKTMYEDQNNIRSTFFDVKEYGGSPAMPHNRIHRSYQIRARTENMNPWTNLWSSMKCCYHSNSICKFIKLHLVVMLLLMHIKMWQTLSMGWRGWSIIMKIEIMNCSNAVLLWW